VSLILPVGFAVFMWALVCIGALAWITRVPVAPPGATPMIQKEWRYLIEHKSGPWYIGYERGVKNDLLALVQTLDEAFRYTTKAEAEAVRLTFDSFRDTYRVVATFEEVSRAR
jgi:hypothetical protein